MYEYKFEQIEAAQLTWSGFKVDESEYQTVIQERAQQGWRFVQIFAPPLTGQGRAKYYELIFERKIPNDAG